MNTTYQARLLNSDQLLEATIEAPEDKFLLDVSEQEVLELPFYRSLDLHINRHESDSLIFSYQNSVDNSDSQMRSPNQLMKSTKYN
ncbi:MAG: hypothetical protein F6K36_25410 [Symploca sp. SIO3C6]|uniref:Uncharacterized protein n=1 Tax=Symploca sp. SIO1C4 TaxID=2607765 RepID=A0A6B3NDT3_9CYAN|nr:hypothetical protein [Symploca sp. SIO3C6]NER31666.1 hypothetical protein [Symploca sp. SIO1C4]NET03201.1 hypothetical protein [Symploca sp. SIO2B6]